METPDIITSRLERTSRRQTKIIAHGCPSVVKSSSRPDTIGLGMGNGYTLILSIEDADWLARSIEGALMGARKK